LKYLKVILLAEPALSQWLTLQMMIVIGNSEENNVEQRNVIISSHDSPALCASHRKVTDPSLD
jgi:hypothetical protein